MSNLSKKDILEILHSFEIKEEKDTTKDITLVKFHQPSSFNSLTSFYYQAKAYYILIDGEADDRKNYILNEVNKVSHDKTRFRLITNPKDKIAKTYGMPFRGKSCYLIGQLSIDKQRLDQVLASKFPEKSRSQWQKHIRLGHVLINEAIVESTKENVSQTDRISFNLPDKIDYQELDLPIIYLDENIIVIDKPAGVLSHSKGETNEEFTVADFFKRYTSYNIETNRPGIVHRLDRDTSGLMIGARNQATAKQLEKQFADRLTTKTYIAITSGIPKNSQARIDLPISRNLAKPKTFKVNSNGKSAITDYEILDIKEDKALIKLIPKTGRTHQLRVHLAYLNCPILGDRIYGKSQDRLYLHAYSLEINVPDLGKKIFKASLPKDFNNFFSKIKL